MTSSEFSSTPGAEGNDSGGGEASIEVAVDGEILRGRRGQSIAAVLLGAGRDSWRTTASERRRRGVYCGIGVCFDCVAEVNGLRDVRLCQREAQDGDSVITQDDSRDTERHRA